MIIISFLPNDLIVHQPSQQEVLHILLAVFDQFGSMAGCLLNTK